jgi:hypothetical protein
MPGRADDAGGEIALRLGRVEQLFDAIDPSPFVGKDLAPRAEAFILDWAREIPPDARLAIRVRLPPGEAARPEAAEIPAGLRAYFAGRAEAARAERRELFRTGRAALAVGLGTLTLCLIASQALTALIPWPTPARVAEESLIILGWVANWRPLEIYLYDTTGGRSGGAGGSSSGSRGRR